MTPPGPISSNRRRPADSPALSRPWRREGQPRLLWDSDVFLPVILGAIEGAGERIDIEMYLCESGVLFDRFLAALRSARERGVRVRFLIDAVGSAGLHDEDRESLRRAGVDLRVFNPLRFGHKLQALVRDHRKVIVVDDDRAFTGGMCVSDEYDPQYSGPATWLDAMVEVGGQVAGDFRALFEQSWQLAAQGRIREVVRWRLRTDIKEAPGLDADDPGPRVRITAARGGRHNPLLVTLVRRIRRAERQVWLCTPYFFPPRALLHVMRHAARRGVQVTLSLPGDITDHPTMRTAGQHYYQQLLDAGVRILEYQPRFIHLKAAQVDDWITIGSSNYDRWNLRWNLDANLEIIDPAVMEVLAFHRQELDAQCVEITRDAWIRRGIWHRWQERFWHWLGTRLHRWLSWLRKPRP